MALNVAHPIILYNILKCLISKHYVIRLLTGNIHEYHQVITHMKGTEGWEGDLP